MKETVISLSAAVFMLYFPYLWHRARNETAEEYGLVWDFNKKDFFETLILTAAVLAALTVVAMNWPWEKLPRARRAFDALNLGASGLAAAIIEETFFRGWLQPLFSRRFSPYAAIILTNLVFAPCHLFVAPYSISLCTFFPGLIMGWLKYRYKNLFPPALFHFLGNVWSIWFFPSPI